MRLPELIRTAYPESAAAAASLPDRLVTGIAQDTVHVAPGNVFVARVGARVDAHRFARQAQEAGAICVVGTRAGDRPVPGLEVPYLQVPDDRSAVARLAAAFHGHPSRRTRVLGVTGTDGKTTTSTLLWWLLSGNEPTALLSTALVRLGQESASMEGHFTTPEATEVQAFLAAAADAGLSRTVLEASSHGLAQRRLDEVDFARALWTNLSAEHLDFHGTIDAYRDAKLQLIERAPAAVLNRDDPAYPAFAAAASDHVSYGEHRQADWRLLGVNEDPGRMRLRFGTPEGREHRADLPTVGSFNAWNALAALAAASEEGGDVDASIARLASFPGVPGRMQVIQPAPFAVIVDFAHTAPALEKALAALAPEGRRIVVVGAAGERDPGKRAPLGAAAVRGADLVILTEEDSRSEDVEAILASMVQGAQEAGGSVGRDVHLLPDRRAAIGEAVRLARPGDVLLLAGKGHERTLERRHETLPWDEAAEARAALRERAEADRDGSA